MQPLQLYPGKYIDSDTSKNPSLKKKKPSLKKILLNISDTQYPVIKYIGKKVLHWQLDYTPIQSLHFDICWTDNMVKPQTLSRMQPHQKINHFPGMTVLSRKNILGRNLMKMRKQEPEQYSFFPMTFLLPNDYLELKCYNMGKKDGKAQTFIVKPEASCQGRGIYLTRNIDKIGNEKCVVQRYMHKPFLLDGLKFDLRIYVLLTGLEPLRIFVHNQGLVRLATQPYTPPKSNNLDEVCMHLTNYAINKESPNFQYNESEEKMDVGHKRSLSYLYEFLEGKGHNVGKLKREINDLIVKTFISGHPTLTYNYRSCQQNNFRGNMCFEVLGFDIMLDYKLKPILLEINYTPSFTTDTPLDSLIKKNVIHDTLNLLNINEKSKLEQKADYQNEIRTRLMSAKRKKYTDEERYTFIDREAYKRDLYELENLGGFTRVYPVSQGQIEEYSKFFDLAYELMDPGCVMYATDKYRRKGGEGRGYYQPMYEIPEGKGRGVSCGQGKKRKVGKTKREAESLLAVQRSPKGVSRQKEREREMKNSFYSTKDVNKQKQKEKEKLIEKEKQKSKDRRKQKSKTKHQTLQKQHPSQKPSQKQKKLKRTKKQPLEQEQLQQIITHRNNYIVRSQSFDSYLNKQ